DETVAMKTNTIICLGCAFWDTIFRVEQIPSQGKVLPDRMVQAADGMATSAAVAIARLGGNAALWSRLGDDVTGERFLADLARERVARAQVRRLPGRTWIATILVDAQGERLVVPYIDPSLDPDPSWLPLHEVAGAGAVLADMRWPEGAGALLRQARHDGVPTILDADVAPVEDLRRLIPLADHVLFSEPALALVEPGPPEDAMLRVAAHSGAAVIGVTLGERGAIVRDRADPPGHLRRVPTIPIRAVDTLNAGDIWHGAYAFGLVEGWDLERRVRFANVAAAIKCERFGGRSGAPTLAEVLDRLRGDNE
ncbi:MAG TPA: PfkB family carbohydrate kinase, partial [Enterovirga sp.]